MVQCYKCKGFEHVMHECPLKDKDHDPKGMKVLYVTFELDDEGSEDFLRKISFMVIEKEREEDFVRASEELYVETIYAWPRRIRSSKSNLRQLPKKSMSFKKN